MRRDDSWRRSAATAALLTAAVAALAAAQQTRPAADPGPSPTLGAPPPPGDRTTVLFDGTAWDQWVTRDGASSTWEVGDDGSVRAVPGAGDAVSRHAAGDFQLHVEFLCPPLGGREGQGRANSGVYLHGRYELQVLDSFGDPPRGNGCGAVYSIAPPLVNAARPAGTWQTYDVAFRAPRLDASGELLERPRLTVIHNGLVIHNNLQLPATTPGGLDRAMVARGPLLLQDHGDPVRYRNIWIRRLD